MKALFAWIGLLAAPSAWAVIDSLPIDAPPTNIQEQTIEDPYKQTETYNYAKGDVYHRWVYNPWMTLQSGEQGAKATFNKLDQESGYVSAELAALTANLEAGKTYKLDAEIHYDCPLKPKDGEEPGCLNEFVVRCYGYVDGKWTRTLEEVRRQEIPQVGSGIFKVENLPVSKGKCSDRINMTIKSHLTAGIDHYLLKELKLALREEK